MAVVNDEVISAQDLNERLQLVTLTSGITDSEQARARLAPQVLRSLIEETLQLQEAERLGITVEDAEIQQALANIAERNRMTVETMQRFFEQNGIDLATLLEQVRAQIAWVKVVNRQIVPRVTVTVDQLEMAVEDARRNEGEPEYLLSEIVLPVDSPAQAQTVAQDVLPVWCRPCAKAPASSRSRRRCRPPPAPRVAATSAGCAAAPCQGSCATPGGHARGRDLRSHTRRRSATTSSGCATGA